MTLQNMIDSSSNIVFFGGAGVSTESGIPGFSKRRRNLSSEICLSAGNDFKSYFF